jgi:hypothetical protein
MLRIIEFFVHLIIGLQTPDAFLYHYTRADIAKDCILPKRMLKFGSITKTNDPKETRDWTFALGTQTNRSLGNYDLKDLSARLSDALKTNTKVVCFCRDSQPLSGDQLRDVFLRGWSKPRMWAQYAASPTAEGRIKGHTGVCLVFDRQKLDQAICRKFGFYSRIYRGDVNYLNRSVVHDWAGDFTINIDVLEQLGFEQYAKNHFHTFVKRLFFEKMLDWRDEHEFRWIIADNGPDDVFVEISSSLAGIVYGDDTNEADTKVMLELTHDLPIQHIGLKWNNSSPWYDFTNPLFSRPMQKSVAS